MRAGDDTPAEEDGVSLLVSPCDGHEVMKVEDDQAAESDIEGDEEAIRIDEPPVRHGAEPDGRAVRRLADPRLPTQDEIDLHNLTHVPNRNWCPVCVRCRGRDLDHRRAVEEERGISEYAFDYCFPGDEFDFNLVVLAGREKITGAYFATAVPRKGSSGRFAVDKALDYVHDIGDRGARILVKSDQEPAIRTWVRDLCEAREEGRTVVEESPVKSSRSNG